MKDRNGIAHHMPMYRLAEELLRRIDDEDHKGQRETLAKIRLRLSEPYSSWCGIEQLGAYERGLEDAKKGKE